MKTRIARSPVTNFESYLLPAPFTPTSVLAQPPKRPSLLQVHVSRAVECSLQSPSGDLHWVVLESNCDCSNKGQRGELGLPLTCPSGSWKYSGALMKREAYSECLREGHVTRAIYQLHMPDIMNVR